jgi:hypothetical protein
MMPLFEHELKNNIKDSSDKMVKAKMLEQVLNLVDVIAIRCKFHLAYNFYL